MSRKDTRKAPLPSAWMIDKPSRHYNPSKAEQAQTMDMPGIKMATLRSAFFRPIKDQSKRGSK